METRSPKSSQSIFKYPKVYKMRLFTLIGLAPLALGATTLIPTTCFDSYTDLEEYFAYLYPWGSDHNGAARMVGNSTDHEYISVNSSTLTLVAKPVTGQPATSSGVAINYLSGTVHSADTFTVEAGSGFNIQAEFQATTEEGTWPAFWLNGANTWPPEIDIAEWKGTGDISFNTFNTSSEVEAVNVDYPSPDEFHTVRSEIRDEDGSNISIKFYLDDELVTTQYGNDYVGKPLYLIIDLQMEGSSGSPGPTTDAYYLIRNLSFEQI
ncbi:putative glycoside hydrolase [Aspergillus ellipticus CBS 707.79]|uniref:Putative glycoside hydrolase n=1 Tax=Aspergillus ellipticus CBS 707.79 TaxID=1448320 RepID=A0A319DKB9_9EURO|nr:putative glycoside hydrolase [Aspergillus ellipticus CBS 707.79]